MALDAATTPLAIALTQGSADAFVQGSVLTGLTGRQAYNVKAIMIEFLSSSGLYTVAADSEVSVAITRRSKTSMPNLADSDVLYKRIFNFALVTSGVAYFNGVEIYVPQIEMPLVEETIYAQLDSTGTTLTLAAVVRLEVELDTMSDIDRLNLIARSLT